MAYHGNQRTSNECTGCHVKSWIPNQNIWLASDTKYELLYHTVWRHLNAFKMRNFSGTALLNWYIGSSSQIYVQGSRWSCNVKWDIMMSSCFVKIEMVVRPLNLLCQYSQAVRAYLVGRISIFSDTIRSYDLPHHH